MLKYTIEGNINFNEELYKMLDEDSDNEDELCQITGLSLKEKHVILECNHHFNYDALYKEIYKQKYEFKTYDPHTLSKKDLLKFRNSKLDYFIKCPYCRNIQFSILPYYEELGLKQIYGINSLDKTLPNTIILSNSYNNQPKPYYGNPNYTFKCFGVLFKSGQCCEKINSFGDTCVHKYTSTIPNTQLSYCRYHYREGLKTYKMSEKKKIIDAKLAAKKEKMDKINEKKKLLEEMNAKRESNGMAPLKRLPVIKKKVENIVEQQEQQIQQYIPEDVGCIAILKTGINKGKQCGCKKICVNGLCKRHSSKEDKNDELNVEKNVL